MSVKSEKAALIIWTNYKKYLGAQHMGNQDKECCVRKLSTIIQSVYGEEVNHPLDHFCTICGESYVFPEMGQDTCDACLSHI